MPQSRRERVRFFVAVLLLAVGPAAADPLFTLSEDGKTFLYRARPGHHPGVVAELFGISTRDLPAFLRRAGAGGYGRSLCTELAEKRRASLGERQESSRRILDLEQRIRTLEAQLSPRVIVGGRGSG